MSSGGQISVEGLPPTLRSIMEDLLPMLPGKGFSENTKSMLEGMREAIGCLLEQISSTRTPSFPRATSARTTTPLESHVPPTTPIIPHPPQSPLTPVPPAHAASAPGSKRKKKKSKKLPPPIPSLSINSPEGVAANPAWPLQGPDKLESPFPRQSSHMSIVAQLVKPMPMTGGSTGMFTHWKDVELGKLLGAGGFGTVYRSQVQFAVKVVQILSGSEEDMHQQRVSIDKEIKHLRDFHKRAADECVNLVRAYDAFFVEEMDQVRIVMEFMDCGSLGSIITARGGEKNPISFKAIASIVFQTATALRYLHSLEKLHRDLKPDNLLVNSHGLVKIGDFGTARTVPTKTSAMTLIGTETYKSPEMCHGDEFYSFPVDVWSLGLCIGECARGAHPYPYGRKDHVDYRQPLAQLEQMKSPPDCSYLPDNLAHLIRRTLTHNPALRMSADGILVSPFLFEHLPDLGDAEPEARQRLATLARCIVIEEVCLPLKAARKKKKAEKVAPMATEVVPAPFPVGAVLAAQKSDLGWIAEKDLKVGDKLADGFYGRVFRGRLHESEVAVKEQKFRQSQSDFEAFLKEIANLRRVRHQQIVTYYGFCMREGSYCLVMEFCSGGGLLTLLESLKDNARRDGRMRLETVSRICDDVCNALHFLHCQQIVHRDVSARNILVNISKHSKHDGHSFKLGDLGLAGTYRELSGLDMLDRSIDIHGDGNDVGRALSGLHALRGSQSSLDGSEGNSDPRYTSPEGFRERKFGPESDVWAVGCTLWEIFHYGTRAPYEEECSGPAAPADVPECSALQLMNAVCQGKKLKQPRAAPTIFWRQVVLPCFNGVATRPSANQVRKLGIQCGKDIEDEYKRDLSELLIPLPAPEDPEDATFECFARDKHPWHDHPLLPRDMHVLRGWSRFLCLVCRVKYTSKRKVVRICDKCGYFMCEDCFTRTRHTGGSLTGEFQGRLQAGKATGSGVLEVEGIGRFEGTFDEHSFKSGVMTYKTGWTYEGGWKYGAKHGRGRDSSNETPGSTYEGEYKYNLRDG
eukprot:Hpha_TRINITY_DN12976_c0_g1::TRINITY_DN12976_c0_g1_i1::g.164348::m.164348